MNCRRIVWFALSVLLFWAVPAARPLAAAELQAAVLAGDTVELERLLKAHPEFVDARDPEGRTALHLAAAGGHLEAARLLIGYGAGVNLTDRGGRTPLMLAESAHAAPVVELLRQHGAGAVDFSKVNDSVIGGMTWCIFGGVALFGLLLFFKIVTKKKKSPEELLAEELNDQ